MLEIILSFNLSVELSCSRISHLDLETLEHLWLFTPDKSYKDKAHATANSQSARFRM